MIDGVSYRVNRLAWFYVHGKWPKGEIDHDNGIKDDDRIDNLKDATHSDNMRNQPGPHKDNQTGFLGVCKEGNRFRAVFAGKWLGTHPTPEAASAAYWNERGQQ